MGIWFTLAPLAFAVKHERGLASLWQSKALAQGRWWEVFGRIFVYIILLILVMIAASILVSLLTLDFRSSITNVIAMLSVPFTISFLSALYDAVAAKGPVIKTVNRRPVYVMAVLGLIMWILAGYGAVQAAGSFMNALNGVDLKSLIESGLNKEGFDFNNDDWPAEWLPETGENDVPLP